MTSMNINNLISSIQKLDAWVQKNNYQGYENYDGLTSWLRYFTFKNWFAERCVMQFFKRSPFNFRPILGVKPLYSTKGMGFFAKGYLKLYQATGDNTYRENAIFCLNWLLKNYSRGYSGYCWGNNFDYSSGGFQLPKYAPTVVWSGLIGHVFLDAYKILHKDEYLDIARSVCDFIMKDLLRTEFEESICISYVTFKKLLVHNANMIAASLLARTYSYTKESSLFDLSRKAFRYSCDSQLDNGAWYYAESNNGKWIDNWHTAYDLDALKWYIQSTGDKTFNINLEKGYNFFKKNFFYDDGKPKYYYNKLRWVDIQAASQAIDTFCFFSDHDSDAINMAKKVANWTINNMQDRSGYFYYRDIGWKKVKIPMLHWGQSTMMSALSHLVLISYKDKS